MTGSIGSGHVSSTNDHVRPCNLKLQQRDLTHVLRRPVEPATQSGQSAKAARRAAAVPCSPLLRLRLHTPPQMQRPSTLMWQTPDLGRPEEKEKASRFTATRGSLSFLPLPGFGS